MTRSVLVPSDDGWAGLRVLVLSPTPSFPIDYGNRRRIHFLCRRLKDLGAEIHYLHYPTEEEWGESVPLAEQRRMASEWDAYYVSPVTRPLYTPPVGQDHDLDEWWDPAIGSMLSWLFRVQVFDAFIVNYAWLSKGLEFAPPDVLKILDTHDRFSGRRAMLQANGMPVEYFHISETDERRALNRADVVWAIKSDEAEFFRGLSDRRILTVLHAEPIAGVRPKRRTEALRFGFTGGNNNINLQNFRRFLSVADDFIRRTLLPCEIVVAGSCCDLLDGIDYPFLRKMGRQPSMDSFYDTVDVVLGPMEFSTGLKVRIGEALARGKALIAHAHCFEGYVPGHPYHSLPSFEAMMRACQAVVRQPQIIDDLEKASLESMSRALRSVDHALETTRPDRRQLPSGFVFVIEASQIRDDGLTLDHVCEAAVYVGHQAKILFFIIGDEEPGKAALDRLRALGQLIATGPNVRWSSRRDAVSFDDLLENQQLAFWFTGAIPAMPPRQRRVSATAYLSLPVLAQTLPDPAIADGVRRLKRSFAEVVVMDRAVSPLLSYAASTGVTTHLVPSYWRGDQGETLRFAKSARREAVALLTPAPSGAAFDAILEVACRSTRRPIEIVWDDRGAQEKPSMTGDGASRARLIPLSGYLRHLRQAGSLPRLLVELGHSSAFGALLEMTDRAGISRLSLLSPLQPRAVAAGRLSGSATGLAESILTLAEYLQNEAGTATLGYGDVERYTHPGDAGWNLIWGMVKELVERGGESGRLPMAPLPASRSDSTSRPVRTEVVLHFQDRGTYRYAMAGWMGIPGGKKPIEAFGLRPLEAVHPNEIEYKALGPNGRETPWVSDAKLCGTRNASLPLTGFAIRLAAHLRERYDIIYEGAFVDSGLAEPSRNGEFCVPAIADMPLEAMRVRLVERQER